MAKTYHAENPETVRQLASTEDLKKLAKFVLPYLPQLNYKLYPIDV